ncbi:MAG: pseudouridylate synthase, partial [Bacteroidaceae bacterium]|nr:pseudouridylate synthase [Bacteroidaceae bacterium]
MVPANFIQPDVEFVRSVDIHTLLPQQEPFVMIGRMEYLDATRMVTSTTFQSDNLFVEDGNLSSLALVENIAQTCAARIGFINKYFLGKDIQLGYIGAVRNFVVHALPTVGEEVRTEVNV